MFIWLLSFGLLCTSSPDLTLATAHLRLEEVQESIVNINHVNEHGSTRLHEAIIKNDLRTLQFLFSKPQLNVSIRNDNHMTPLDLAIRLNRVQATKWLVQHHSIQLDTVDQFGRTPLIKAVRNYREDVHDVVKIILSSRRVDVNHADKEGKTALIYAVKYKQIASVRLLLRAENVEINLRDRHGRSAFDYVLTCPRLGLLPVWFEVVQEKYNALAEQLPSMPLPALESIGHRLQEMYAPRVSQKYIKDLIIDQEWRLINHSEHRDSLAPLPNDFHERVNTMAEKVAAQQYALLTGFDVTRS